MDYLQKGKTIKLNNIIIFWINASYCERKRLVKKEFLYHQENPHIHTSGIVTAKLHELKFEIFLHVPSAVDIPFYDYSLFANLKKILTGRKFCSDTDVVSAINVYFESQDESSSRKRIQEFLEASVFLSTGCLKTK